MDPFQSQFDAVPLPDDLEPEEFVQLVSNLTELGRTYAEQVDTSHFLDTDSPQEVATDVENDPPWKKLAPDQIIAFVKNHLTNFPSTGSKHFLGYIPSDPTKESIALGALTPFFNQFVGSVQGSPAGVAIESLVLRWIADLLGLPSSSFGCFTSGGSMANLTAIYTGLVEQLRVHGIDFMEDGIVGSRRPVVYFSEETHYASEKAMHVLGLGRKSMRKLPTNDRFELTAETVEKQIQTDLEADLLPLMIIATSGTTNTGSIDHLEGLYDLSRRYDLWFHVDGAYGAFSHLAKGPISDRTATLSLADSIALDCHKWFYTPFEAGITLVRDHQILRSGFDISGEYVRDSDLEHDIPLQRNFRSYSFQLTRELRGLKVWGAFASLGVEGLRNAITRDIIKANYLRFLVERHPDFALYPGGELSIVCFRYLGNDEDNQSIIDYINHRDKFYFNSTKVQGRVALRVCFINRRSDLQMVEELFTMIVDATHTLN